MFEMFEYSFMIRSFIAGCLVAISVPVLGSFLLARRYALIADSLAHVSLAGVGIGLVLGVAPVLAALPLALLGSLALEYLRQKRQIRSDASLAVLMSGGLAVAVVLASSAQGSGVDFNSYLFGSIATTSQADLYVLGVAAVAVVALVAKYYRGLLYIAFDEDGAKVAGYRVAALNYLLVAMTAVVVVLSLRIIGGLLISALLVIPVLTASRYAASFAQTIAYSVVCAAAAIVVGLSAAFYIGVPAGGAIVLASLVLFGLSLFQKQ